MKMYERIRNYIESNGLRLNFVAEKAGIAPQRFYFIINGKTKLMIEEYEQICRKGLSVDPGYFFTQKFLDSKKNA